MNRNMNLLVSRRRKLGIEEVYDVYGEPPIKTNKTAHPDEQVVDSGMAVDAPSVPFLASQFPVSSFPLEGINGFVSNHGSSLISAAQSVPPFFKSSGSNGTWSQRTLNLPMDSDAIGASNTDHAEHINSIRQGSSGGAQQDNEMMTAQRVSTTHQGGNCPQCLSGKSGHFRHIQSRILQLQKESRYPDGMTHQNTNGYTDGMMYLPKTNPKTQRYPSGITHQLLDNTPME